MKKVLLTFFTVLSFSILHAQDVEVESGAKLVFNKPLGQNGTWAEGSIVDNDVLFFEISKFRIGTVNDNDADGLFNVIGRGGKTSLVLQLPTIDGGEADNDFDQGLAYQNSGGAYTWTLYRTPHEIEENQAHFRIAGGQANGNASNLTDYFGINKDGKVGIGLNDFSNLANNNAKFNVVGDGLIADFRHTSSSGVDGGIKIVGARNASTANTTSYISLANYDSNEGNGSEYVMAQVAAGMGDVSGNRGYLQFSTNAGNNLQERMRILDNGKVAIGITTVPSNYRLAVKGDIIAEGLKIADYGTTDWSDFVFEPTYKLMPLSQVEQYILANKHLPDVPSAKEVAENGIDVASMDATLLQKIEELTLYTIEQEKQLKTQSEIIEKQQALLEQLVKEVAELKKR